MLRRRECLAGLAVALWAVLWWVAWALGWYGLLQALAFAAFAIPFAVGYLAAQLLAGRAGTGQPATTFMALVAVLAALLAYACCVFAIGRLAMLIPEFYKFGRTLIDFTLSSVARWAVASVVCLATALVVRHYVASASLAGVLSRASIGMVTFGALLIGPSLLSLYAKQRA